MGKKNILVMADRLTVYAIERQAGMERHQPPGSPPWMEQRRLWTDSILQGMARLGGLTPDPKLMEQFDQRLEAARGCSAVEHLPPREQTALVRALSRYISALESASGDHRRQIAVIGDLFEDMVTHPSWDLTGSGLLRAGDRAEIMLQRMTAQMPIRFTRILLGGDAGPHWVSGFVPGAVTDAEAIKQTPVYQSAVQDYPEITDWPALCTVYVGRDLPIALGAWDACEFDLKIMNRMGDRFLDEPGIRSVGGPYQMMVSCGPEMSAVAEEHIAAENCPLLQGVRPLEPDDLEVYEYFGEDEGRITFFLDMLTDEQSVFGKTLSCEREGSYAVVYGTYDEATGQVCELLDVEQRYPHDEHWFCCKLTEEVRESLRQKMDDFYMEICGEGLPVRSQEERPPSQMSQTM